MSVCESVGIMPFFSGYTWPKGEHIIDAVCQYYHSEAPRSLLRRHKPDFGLGSGAGSGSAEIKFHHHFLILSLSGCISGSQACCSNSCCQKDSGSFLTGVLLPCKYKRARRAMFGLVWNPGSIQEPYIIFQWVCQGRTDITPSTCRI